MLPYYWSPSIFRSLNCHIWGVGQLDVAGIRIYVPS